MTQYLAGFLGIRGRRGRFYPSIVIVLAAFTGVMLLLGGISHRRGMHPRPKARVPDSTVGLRPFHLGLECPGVMLYVPSPAGPFPHIVAKTHGRSKRILELDDLRGLVRIRSAQDALRYVRLGTSDATGTCVSIDQGCGFNEINSTDDLPALPTFGERTPITRQEAAAWPYLGQDGVITPQDFRAGGFQAPQVREVSGGYVVTRWMLFSELSRPEVLRDNKTSSAHIWMGKLPDYSNHFMVGLVEERVGSDGSYQQRVLGMKPAPRLSHSDWQWDDVD